jgi:hypothetical protein
MAARRPTGRKRAAKGTPAKKKSAKRRKAKAGKRAARRTKSASGSKKAGSTRPARTKKTAAKRRARRREGRAHEVDLGAIRRAALALPGVEEGTSYGTPAFRVGKKLMLRLHDDGENLVVRLDHDTIEMLVSTEGAVFHKTPHYEGWPYVLARRSLLTRARLSALVEDAWDLLASRRLRAVREARR